MNEPKTEPQIRLTGGFWQKKQELNRKETIWGVYRRFRESGRFDALACRPDSGIDVHWFWDSDVAKWIEAVAYLTAGHPEPELEKLADEMIESIAAAQDADGYYNSYFLLLPREERFRNRCRHELYCAGHLMEAAVAYKRATGKDLLYRCMLKYAALIDRVFRVEKSAGFLTPGHQEIELALIELWRESGDERWLTLAEYFLNARGSEAERVSARIDEDRMDYAQDRYPVREQTGAEGHAVRLLYMAIAMAEIAELRGDAEMRGACLRIFNDIVRHKIYITGGLGSNCNIEGFDEPYFLPNDTAYAETCASIALILFARRMQALDESSVYADVIERTLYNGMLSGISLDGRAFFYENPLEIDLAAPKRLFGRKTLIHYPPARREELFGCSCCPPNLARFLPRVGDLVASAEDGTIRVHQYMQSEIRVDGATLVMKTDYPKSGIVEVRYSGDARRVGFRIPAWCGSWKLSRDGHSEQGTVRNGYCWLSLAGDSRVTLEFYMPVGFTEANPGVRADAGRVAVPRGPGVYCAEQCDNADVRLFDFCVDSTAEPQLGAPDASGLNTVTVYGTVREQCPEVLYSNVGFRRKRATLKLIPYHAFANREECDMIVWIRK